MLSLKKRLNMIFWENGIEQALHDEAIGWRIETDKNAKRVSRVFIADGSQCWPSNGEAINGIDDEKIKLREIKFGALVGTCWLGTKLRLMMIARSGLIPSSGAVNF